MVTPKDSTETNVSIVMATPLATQPGTTVIHFCLALVVHSHHLPKQKIELVDWPEPSFCFFQSHEKQYAYQDYEADRRIGAGEIIAFGKIVDELSETTEIDEKFVPDDINQREYQANADAYKDRWKGRGKKDFPELLRCRQLEAASDIDENLSCAGNPLDGLKDDGRQRR